MMMMKSTIIRASKIINPDLEAHIDIMIKKDPTMDKETDLTMDKETVLTMDKETVPTIDKETVGKEEEVNKTEVEVERPIEVRREVPSEDKEPKAETTAVTDKNMVVSNRMNPLILCLKRQNMKVKLKLETMMIK